MFGIKEMTTKPNDKNYFDLSDAKKKRILQKAAEDGARMQREMISNETKKPSETEQATYKVIDNDLGREVIAAVRKQAITEAIEALSVQHFYGLQNEVCEAGEKYRALTWNDAMEWLEYLIAALKEKEGLE